MTSHIYGRKTIAIL